MSQRPDRTTTLSKIWKKWWFPLLAILVSWRVVLYIWSAIVYSLNRPVLIPGYMAPAMLPSSLPAWLAGWGNFDGIIFMKVAFGGYGVSEVPFFPLLPFLISAVSKVTFLPLPAVGVLISTLIFPLGIYWAYKLWQLDAPRRSFLWFFLVLISFPTAHYFTAVYQDALFFTLATGTLLTARHKHWGRAVLLACLATTARLNGLALFAFLLAEYWLAVAPSLQKKWNFWPLIRSVPLALDWRKWLGKQRYVWLFLLVPLTFVGYLAWIHFKFGDWHLFFSGVAVWHRDRFVLPPQTFWRYAKILVLTFGLSLVYFVAVLEASMTALYGWILLQQWGKLRFSYWLWMVAHFTIPVVTGTLQGMPRYGLHLYPLFLVMAGWTAPWPRWAKALYLIAGFGLQAWLSLWFLRGYFIA